MLVPPIKRARLGLFAFGVVLLLPVCGAAASAQSFEAWMQRGSAAEARRDPVEALKHYRHALALRPKDAEANYRVAKQLFDQTFFTRDDEDVRRLAEEALTYAERALELEESAPHLVAVAVLYGQLGLYGDNRTKVDYARRIKRNAERALELDPDYAWAHHVLGRWHVEISQLGFARRMIASLIYGGLPGGKLSTGLKHLQRAHELEPNALPHLVELGYAYAANDEKDRALDYWQQTTASDSVEIYDRAARARARRGLRRLQEADEN